jgi:hypothetical protein
MPVLASNHSAGILTIYADIGHRHHGIVKKLEQRGFSRTQAEGITDALKELDTTNLVTKADLQVALAKQSVTIITWMTAMLLAQGALVVALIQYFK